MDLGSGIGAARGEPQGADASCAPPLHAALALLRGLVDDASLVLAQGRSDAHGTCPLAELVMLGEGSEEAIYRALAEALALPFIAEPDPIVLRRTDRSIAVGARVVLSRQGDVSRWLVAPTATHAEALAHHADASVAVVTPSAMAALVERARGNRATALAVHSLHRERPEGSARTVMTARQGFAAAGWLSLLLVAFALVPNVAVLVVHAVATVLFSACVGLRVLAAASAAPPRYPALGPLHGRDAPHYTVLAVLYREAPVVPQLIAHLSRLQWPGAKLDIRLVCEADDAGTLDAIAACEVPPNMRVVRVPPGEPRTKPKALNYALDGVRDGLVVVYDAEDRPHPYQLREAYEAFRRGGPQLACLQAALQIDNGARSFLSRGFAVEYAALFRGLLPWLAERKLPLPLGGTSNHFRLHALREVGGWDPFNVTEDADLGFRLYRHGYRIGTIGRPTLEAAPTTWPIWRDQRTRWLKGWAQTWLVHMRSPALFVREAGWGGFAILQIAMLGILGSALLHPLMFVTLLSVCLAAIADLAPTGLAAWLLALDTVNVALGYAAMWLLASAVLHPRERWLLHGAWWRVPLYWLHLVPPAWRAVAELLHAPHRWSKTPHEPVDPSP